MAHRKANCPKLVMQGVVLRTISPPGPASQKNSNLQSAVGGNLPALFIGASSPFLLVVALVKQFEVFS